MTQQPDAASQVTGARAPAHPVKQVVVPVGGSDREFLAQEQAVILASALGVPLRALHVAPDPDTAPSDVFAFLEKACRTQDVAFESRVIGGDDPAEELVQEVDALDLLVMGTQRLGTRYHLGSVAERVIRDAPAMVQVVRLNP